MKLSPVFTFYFFPSLFPFSFLLLFLTFVEGRLFYSLSSPSFSFFCLLFLSHLFGYFVFSLFLAEPVIFFRFILLSYPLLFWIACVFAGNCYDFISRDANLASFWNLSFLCLQSLCPILLPNKFST
jgi:hypothetical protein